MDILSQVIDVVSVHIKIFESRLWIEYVDDKFSILKKVYLHQLDWFFSLVLLFEIISITVLLIFVNDVWKIVFKI